jgi:ABC-type bacteriocin/lantibiotic exporter with double-glycine peptidase domain
MHDPVRSASAFGAMRRIWQEANSVRGSTPLIAASLLATLFSSTLILPLCMERITGLLQRNSTLESIFNTLFISFTLLLVGYYAEWMTNRQAATVNQRICLRLVDRQVDGYLRSPLAAFNHHSPRHYITAVSEVTEILQSHQLFMLQTSIISLAVTALSLVLLAQYDLWFLAITLPFLLAICGLPILLATLAGRYIQAESPAFAGLGSYIEALVSKRREWYFANGSNLLRHADQLIDNLHHAQTGKWWIWNLSFNLKLTQNLILYALTLLVGGLLYLDGQINLGTAIGGYLLVAMVAPKFDSLYKLYNFAQASAAAYQTLDQFALEKRPERQPRFVSDADARIKTISLDIKDFRHANAQAAIIKQATLNLFEGDRCLIVGQSGSGKSTLIDLLLGILSASSAQLSINGIPIDDYGLERYWRDIAYVPNPDFLFEDLSAEENLGFYGNPAALGTTNWAESLDWKTFSQTTARAMSGGERQRLSILRALSRDCAVMVFDEPSSALDEANIQKSFEILTKPSPKIVVVASHSKDAEPFFNRLFAMQDGILVERK